MGNQVQNHTRKEVKEHYLHPSPNHRTKTIQQTKQETDLSPSYITLQRTVQWQQSSNLLLQNAKVVKNTATSDIRNYSEVDYSVQGKGEKGNHMLPEE